LIEQFPDLNQTLLDKYEKKIKLNFQKRKIENRQADNGAADYSDGLDVQVSLEVASTTKALNNEAAINATILAKEFELGEAVTGIAWLELMSTDEQNLNDTVIFKQTYEEYLEKNDFKINQIGALKVFSPDFKAGNTETGPDYVEVITNPTTSSGVWEFWWIPFMIVMILLILVVIVILIIRRRRRKRRKLPPTIEY